MLHIHNGDSTADTAKQSSLPGEHFAWRESLITGPTPAGLSGNDWRSLRARHLSESYGVDLRECEQNLLRQEEKLRAFSEHDEVVLWFEHDLFCQVHLVYLLDWLSQRDEINDSGTRLSLICVGEFPGKENFRGLGELNAEQLASLFPARQPVTTAQLNLAASAWGAYCSPDPTALAKLLQVETSTTTTLTSPLPFLSGALQAHLRRFPDTKNGLGRIENCALHLIDQGLNSFTDLFRGFSEAESIYGFGDAQFWLALQRLSAAPKPLLAITNAANGGDTNKGERVAQTLRPGVMRNATFELTELGRSALRGEGDFVALNGINLWLGGVHLRDADNVWRWDGESKTIEKVRHADQ